MEFPHLNDTQFPNIKNLNVYKYQNNFDYARWQGKVTFKLLNVLWNSNCADVPYFESDEVRDEWFDSQAGFVGTLESLFNNTPDNSIKIPIPYNDAYKYNYLIIDLPIQTSWDNPINYENSITRVSRWFYFIEDMTQFAPNATELKITVDYWTTFIHSVEIPYLMLERGHAPMFQTTVDSYLNNPIENNEYLLAEDFNFGNDTLIKTSNYVPIGNGTKYVLFCVPLKQSDFANLDGTAYNGNSTPPTFSDTTERWGYQIQVNDYAWKYGNTNYSNAQLPISNETQDGILNGCECYAIEGIHAQAFFNAMATTHVHFIHAIQAMFILDGGLFTRATGFTFNGYTIYPAKRKITSQNITLSKSQFDFDSKYADITKLYTSPYSMLEITDDEGNVFAAKVENCGQLKLHNEISLIYPFLNYNVFLSGVNGDGSSQYIWKDINNTSITKNIWASDFSKFMMNWQIPTYSIFVSSEFEYAVNNAAGIAAQRERAIKDYENSVRFGNTTRENTSDSFATATSNMNRTTTKNVNNTAATQDGLVDNMEDVNYMNEYITDVLQNSGDLSQITSDGAADICGYNVSTAWYNYEKVSKDAIVDLQLMQNSLSINVDYDIGMGVLNSAMGLFGGAVQNGDASTETSSSNLPLIGGVANAVATAIATGMTITRNSAVVQKQEIAIGAKVVNAHNNAVSLVGAQQRYGHGVMAVNNTTREDITKRFSDVTGINNSNESRNKVCDDANAAATQTTETNNATYTRNANVVAEKANLVQKQLEVEAQYKNNRLQRPTTYSDYNGDFMPDALQRRGVRINVRTQTKSAIAQAGDAMLRFGYALHRVWDMSSGFHYGKHFTFWKAEDIWINDGSGVANIATNAIGNILMKGVTIWKNPEEIGRVGIYDNM